MTTDFSQATSLAAREVEAVRPAAALRFRKVYRGMWAEHRAVRGRTVELVRNEQAMSKRGVAEGAWRM